MYKKGCCLLSNVPYTAMQLIYCFTMVLPEIVSPPILACARPSSIAPVLKGMDCMAITVALNTEVVPNVAELPTCQRMFEANAPPLRITLRPQATSPLMQREIRMQSLLYG